MKQARKTPNIMIRDLSKKSKEQPQSTFMISKTSFNDKKKTSLNEIETQKQLIRAQNLSQQEQIKIRKQAERTVSRKVQNTQNKIEDRISQMLEQQCKKTGQELQKEKAQNNKLKTQIHLMRKNIDYLNRKIEGMFKDQESLSKNNDFGKMEKEQIKQQVINLQTALKTKQQQFQYQTFKYNSSIQQLTKSNNQKQTKIIKMESDIKCLRQEIQELCCQMEETKNENKYIRKQFQQKKEEWDRIRREHQENNKLQIEKKGEKITKYHVQLQNLTQKLKEEENIRKKLLDKNKDLQKEVQKKNDIIKDQQQQLVTLKKRVNDLSILKSTNNTIMANKISALQTENAALKAQPNNLNFQKHGEQQKPYLFGPNFE